MNAPPPIVAAAAKKRNAAASSSCPYAAALYHNNSNSSDNDCSDGESSTDTTTSKLILSCPAFERGSCPFAGCADEDAVRQQLLKIPPSHYVAGGGGGGGNNGAASEKGGGGAGPQFLQVLQELHAVAGSGALAQNKNHGGVQPKFLMTGCPVASKVPVLAATTATSTFQQEQQQQQQKQQPVALNFTQAMEGYSLAAIMARMAEEMELSTEAAAEHSTIAASHASHAADSDATAVVVDHNASEGNAALEKSAANRADEENSAAPLKITQPPPHHPSQDHVVGPAASQQQQSQQQQQPHTTTTTTRRLSVSFKQGTAVSHQAAEDVHFVRNFIRGQIDRTLYAELVVQLYHVYDTLEGCLLLQQQQQNNDAKNNSSSSISSNSSLQQFADFHRQLQRKQTLVDDLDFWHGPARTEQIVARGAGLSPAARDYVERLRHVAQTNPLLLLAHSYTRYLGDLSGGKILARVARKAMDLDNTDGLAFYDFDATIPSAKKFKDAFRTALDALELGDADISQLVAEANVAFLLNMRLFEELDVAAGVPGAAVRPLADALAYAEQEKQQQHADAASSIILAPNIPKECPFAKMGAISQTTTTTAMEDAPPAVAKMIPDECPFGKTTTTTTTTASPNIDNTSKTVSGGKHGRCPWPFILAHDPVAALQDWQTWALVGLILCYMWSKLQK